ncbi:MAG: TetR/AcrR family transcriptional regulator [Chloroflexi bacterium OHK40]
MTKPDRRVQRTRELIQQALIALIRERGYDPITVQDIVDRANVGRTTFYLHYTSKDDLFLHCHDAILGQFQLSPHTHLAKAALVGPEPPEAMTRAFQHLVEARALLTPILQGKDSLIILRRIRDRSAEEIAAHLRNAYGEAESRIPLDLLASYLAGAQIALIQWWLEKRPPHSAEQLAQSFHRLQRAAIRDAFGLGELEAG